MSDQEINRLSNFIENLGDIKPPPPEIPIMNPVKEVIATVPFDQLINPEKNIFKVFQENKLAPSHLEIAGGHQSDLGFLNVDPLARQGLQLTLQKIPEVIQKESVKRMIFFNPYFDSIIRNFGKLIEDTLDFCLAKEGICLMGGNLSNRYFKEIWKQEWQNFHSLNLLWDNLSPEEQDQLKPLLNKFDPRLYDYLVKGEFYKTSFYTGRKSEAEAKTTVNRLKLIWRQFLIYLIVMNCY